MMARKRQADLQKTFVAAIAVNILETVCGLAVVALVFLHETAFHQIPGKVFFVVMGLVVIWSAVVDIRDAFSAKHAGEENDMLEDAYGKLSELNGTMRKQRHDFMNHLQVIYSLLEMDSAEEAKEYIEQVYQDVQKVGKTLKTAVPAVNALIAAKLSECEEKGIAMKTDVRSAWDKLPVTDWEMCRVLGNLLDNAIEALEDSKEMPSPAIVLTIGETLQEYTFSVANNGPEIPETVRQSIFHEGFTTKARGSGMGLAIVRDILVSNGGSIEAVSEKESTVFSGKLPREKN